MNVWLFIGLWIGSQALQLILAVIELFRPIRSEVVPRRKALQWSTGASFVPLITLVLFLRVFVIGGISHVAQLTGEEGMGLWGLWAAAWMPLFCCIPVVVVIIVIAAVLPPYPPRSWIGFLSRVSAVPASLCAWHAVYTWFPDA